MKKLTTILLAVSLLCACTKTNETDIDIERDGLSLSESNAVVTDPSGVYTFEVETPGNWSVATNYPSWITVSPTQGSGKATVTVTLQPNGTGSDRTVQLTVGGGVEPQQITLRQEAARLEFSPEGLHVFDYASPAPLTVTVTSNTSWSVEHPSWCTVTPVGGTGDGSFTITPAAAGAYSPEAVKVVYPGADKEFFIAQQPAAASGAPAFLYPKNGDTGVSCYPLFQWMRPGDGVNYTAYIGTSPADISVPLVMNDKSGIMAEVSEGLNPSTTYYWRLVGSDGSYSPIAQFNTGTGSYRDGEYRFYQQNVKKDAAGNLLNPINIIIMGDGFVASDYVDGGWFDQMADLAAEHLVSSEPTATMRDYFRISKVCAISEERGTSMGNMTINTVFKWQVSGGYTSYHSDGTSTPLYTYAKNVPGVDDAVLNNSVVMCLINSGIYAAGTAGWTNAGRALARFTLSQPNTVRFQRLVLHEVIGHGLAKLADEYFTLGGTLGQEDADELVRLQNTYGWYHNMSGSTETTPWDMFRGRAGYEAVGTYEGGYASYEFGCWRSEPVSLMGTSPIDGLVIYFNAISRYRIYQRIMNIAGETPSLEHFLVMDEAGRALEKPYVFPSVFHNLNIPHEGIFPPEISEKQ